MAGCLTCELIERRDAGQAPGWDCILRTTRWDVAHAFSVAVEGWVVLVVRRHITALADLTDAEAAELNEIARYRGARSARASRPCAATAP